MVATNTLEKLHQTLSGEVLFDDLHKTIYATDASVYRKIPLAVAFPKDENDIIQLINFATKNKVTLIPRTAGTSLAGQCVGDGIVVDVSKYFTKIFKLDEKNKTISLEPAIVRDDLNAYLKPFGLFFGPNTSTSNRCMIGGMVGNNSSGSTSIKYGVTRDKVLEIEAILSDGSKTIFKEISSDEFIQKTKLNTLEGKIYKTLFTELSSKKQQEEIKKEFPKPSIHRRNTGYAVDEFLSSNLFGGTSPTINVAKLLAGSEGTLAFSTKIKLQLDVLAPQKSIMVCSHFKSINESLKATLVAMKHDLYNCELMDKTILDCTKNNRDLAQNRFFLDSGPEAVLMLEVAADTIEEAENLADKLIAEARRAMDKGNYRWASELLNHLVFAQPDNARAKELLAANYDQLGYQAESGPWRDVYLTGALELRHGTPEKGINIATMKDMLLLTPIENFFDSMAVRLKAEDATDKDWRIRLHFTDLKETYLLWRENSVVHHAKETNSDSDVNATLNLTHPLFVSMLTGEAGLKDTLFSDDLSVDGSRIDLVRFFSLFEKPATSFAIVTPE